MRFGARSLFVFIAILLAVLTVNTVVNAQTPDRWEAKFDFVEAPYSGLEFSADDGTTWVTYTGWFTLTPLPLCNQSIKIRTSNFVCLADDNTELPNADCLEAEINPPTGPIVKEDPIQLPCSTSTAYTCTQCNAVPSCTATVLGSTKSVGCPVADACKCTTIRCQNVGSNPATFDTCLAPPAPNQFQNYVKANPNPYLPAIWDTHFASEFNRQWSRGAVNCLASISFSRQARCFYTHDTTFSTPIAGTEPNCEITAADHTLTLSLADLSSVGGLCAPLKSGECGLRGNNSFEPTDCAQRYLNIPTAQSNFYMDCATASCTGAPNQPFLGEKPIVSTSAVYTPGQEITAQWHCPYSSTAENDVYDRARLFYKSDVDTTAVELFAQPLNYRYSYIAYNNNRSGATCTATFKLPENIKSTLNGQLYFKLYDIEDDLPQSVNEIAVPQGPTTFIRVQNPRYQWGKKCPQIAGEYDDARIIPQCGVKEYTDTELVSAGAVIEDSTVVCFDDQTGEIEIDSSKCGLTAPTDVKTRCYAPSNTCGSNAVCKLNSCECTAQNSVWTYSLFSSGKTGQNERVTDTGMYGDCISSSNVISVELEIAANAPDAQKYGCATTYTLTIGNIGGTTAATVRFNGALVTTATQGSSSTSRTFDITITQDHLDALESPQTLITVGYGWRFGSVLFTHRCPTRTTSINGDALTPFNAGIADAGAKTFIEAMELLVTQNPQWQLRTGFVDGTLLTSPNSDNVVVHLSATIPKIGEYFTFYRSVHCIYLGKSLLDADCGKYQLAPVDDRFYSFRVQSDFTAGSVANHCASSCNALVSTLELTDIEALKCQDSIVRIVIDSANKGYPTVSTVLTDKTNVDAVKEGGTCYRVCSCEVKWGSRIAQGYMLQDTDETFNNPDFYTVETSSCASIKKKRTFIITNKKNQGVTGTPFWSYERDYVPAADIECDYISPAPDTSPDYYGETTLCAGSDAGIDSCKPKRYINPNTSSKCTITSPTGPNALSGPKQCNDIGVNEQGSTYYDDFYQHVHEGNQCKCTPSASLPAFDFHVINATTPDHIEGLIEGHSYRFEWNCLELEYGFMENKASNHVFKVEYRKNPTIVEGVDQFRVMAYNSNYNSATGLCSSTFTAPQHNSTHAQFIITLHPKDKLDVADRLGDEAMIQIPIYQYRWVFPCTENFPVCGNYPSPVDPIVVNAANKANIKCMRSDGYISSNPVQDCLSTADEQIGVPLKTVCYVQYTPTQEYPAPTPCGTNPNAYCLDQQDFVNNHCACAGGNAWSDNDLGGTCITFGQVVTGLDIFSRENELISGLQDGEFYLSWKLSDYYDSYGTWSVAVWFFGNGQAIKLTGQTVTLNASDEEVYGTSTTSFPVDTHQVKLVAPDIYSAGELRLILTRTGTEALVAKHNVQFYEYEWDGVPTDCQAVCLDDMALRQQGIRCVRSTVEDPTQVEIDDSFCERAVGEKDEGCVLGSCANGFQCGTAEENKCHCDAGYFGALCNSSDPTITAVTATFGTGLYFCSSSILVTWTWSPGTHFNVSSAPTNTEVEIYYYRATIDESFEEPEETATLAANGILLGTFLANSQAANVVIAANQHPSHEGYIIVRVKRTRVDNPTLAVASSSTPFRTFCNLAYKCIQKSDLVDETNGLVWAECKPTDKPGNAGWLYDQGNGYVSLSVIDHTAPITKMTPNGVSCFADDTNIETNYAYACNHHLKPIETEIIGAVPKVDSVTCASCGAVETCKVSIEFNNDAVFFYDDDQVAYCNQFCTCSAQCSLPDEDEWSPCQTTDAITTAFNEQEAPAAIPTLGEFFAQYYALDTSKSNQYTCQNAPLKRDVRCVESFHPTTSFGNCMTDAVDTFAGYKTTYQEFNLTNSNAYCNYPDRTPSSSSHSCLSCGVATAVDVPSECTSNIFPGVVVEGLVSNTNASENGEFTTCPKLTNQQCNCEKEVLDAWITDANSNEYEGDSDGVHYIAKEKLTLNWDCQTLTTAADNNFLNVTISIGATEVNGVWKPRYLLPYPVKYRNNIVSAGGDHKCKVSFTLPDEFFAYTTLNVHLIDFRDTTKPDRIVDTFVLQNVHVDQYRWLETTSSCPNAQFSQCGYQRLPGTVTSPVSSSTRGCYRVHKDDAVTFRAVEADDSKCPTVTEDLEVETICTSPRSCGANAKCSQVIDVVEADKLVADDTLDQYTCSCLNDDTYYSYVSSNDFGTNGLECVPDVGIEINHDDVECEEDSHWFEIIRTGDTSSSITFVSSSVTVNNQDGTPATEFVVGTFYSIPFSSITAYNNVLTVEVDGTTLHIPFQLDLKTCEGFEAVTKCTKADGSIVPCQTATAPTEIEDELYQASICEGGSCELITGPVSKAHVCGAGKQVKLSTSWYCQIKDEIVTPDHCNAIVPDEYLYNVDCSAVVCDKCNLADDVFEAIFVDASGSEDDFDLEMDITVANGQCSCDITYTDVDFTPCVAPTSNDDIDFEEWTIDTKSCTTLELSRPTQCTRTLGANESLECDSTETDLCAKYTYTVAATTENPYPLCILPDASTMHGGKRWGCDSCIAASTETGYCLLDIFGTGDVTDYDESRRIIAPECKLTNPQCECPIGFTDAWVAPLDNISLEGQSQLTKDGDNYKVIVANKPYALAWDCQHLSTSASYNATNLQVSISARFAAQPGSLVSLTPVRVAYRHQATRSQAQREYCYIEFQLAETYDFPEFVLSISDISITDPSHPGFPSYDFGSEYRVVQPSWRFDCNTAANPALPVCGSITQAEIDVTPANTATLKCRGKNGQILEDSVCGAKPLTAFQQCSATYPICNDEHAQCYHNATSAISNKCYCTNNQSYAFDQCQGIGEVTVGTTRFTTTDVFDAGRNIHVNWNFVGDATEQVTIWFQYESEDGEDIAIQLTDFATKSITTMSASSKHAELWLPEDMPAVAGGEIVIFTVNSDESALSPKMTILQYEWLLPAGKTDADRLPHVCGTTYDIDICTALPTRIEAPASKCKGTRPSGPAKWPAQLGAQNGQTDQCATTIADELSHGTCVDNVCKCTEGFTGKYCLTRPTLNNVSIRIPAHPAPPTNSNSTVPFQTKRLNEYYCGDLFEIRWAYTGASDQLVDILYVPTKGDADIDFPLEDIEPVLLAHVLANSTSVITHIPDVATKTRTGRIYVRMNTFHEVVSTFDISHNCNVHFKCLDEDLSTFKPCRPFDQTFLEVSADPLTTSPQHWLVDDVDDGYTTLVNLREFFYIPGAPTQSNYMLKCDEPLNVEPRQPLCFVGGTYVNAAYCSELLVRPPQKQTFTATCPPTPNQCQECGITAPSKCTSTLQCTGDADKCIATPEPLSFTMEDSNCNHLCPCALRCTAHNDETPFGDWDACLLEHSLQLSRYFSIDESKPNTCKEVYFKREVECWRNGTSIAGFPPEIIPNGNCGEAPIKAQFTVPLLVDEYTLANPRGLCQKPDLDEYCESCSVKADQVPVCELTYPVNQQWNPNFHISSTTNPTDFEETNPNRGCYVTNQDCRCKVPVTAWVANTDALAVPLVGLNVSRTYSFVWECPRFAPVDQDIDFAFIVQYRLHPNANPKAVTTTSYRSNAIGDRCSVQFMSEPVSSEHGEFIFTIWSSKEGKLSDDVYSDIRLWRYFWARQCPTGQELASCGHYPITTTDAFPERCYRSDGYIGTDEDCGGVSTKPTPENIPNYCFTDPARSDGFLTGRVTPNCQVVEEEVEAGRKGFCMDSQQFTNYCACSNNLQYDAGYCREMSNVQIHLYNEDPSSSYSPSYFTTDRYIQLTWDYNLDTEDVFRVEFVQVDPDTGADAITPVKLATFREVNEEFISDPEPRILAKSTYLYLPHETIEGTYYGRFRIVKIEKDDNGDYQDVESVKSQTNAFFTVIKYYWSPNPLSETAEVDLCNGIVAHCGRAPSVAKCYLSPGKSLVDDSLCANHVLTPFCPISSYTATVSCIAACNGDSGCEDACDSATNDCGLHGDCESNFCTCKPDFIGDHCETNVTQADVFEAFKIATIASTYYCGQDIVIQWQWNGVRDTTAILYVDGSIYKADESADDDSINLSHLFTTIKLQDHENTSFDIQLKLANDTASYGSVTIENVRCDANWRCLKPDTDVAGEIDQVAATEFIPCYADGSPDYVNAWQAFQEGEVLTVPFEELSYGQEFYFAPRAIRCFVGDDDQSQEDDATGPCRYIEAPISTSPIKVEVDGSIVCDICEQEHLSILDGATYAVPEDRECPVKFTLNGVEIDLEVEHLDNCATQCECSYKCAATEAELTTNSRSCSFDDEANLSTFWLVQAGSNDCTSLSIERYRVSSYQHNPTAWSFDTATHEEETLEAEASESYCIKPTTGYDKWCTANAKIIDLSAFAEDDKPKCSLSIGTQVITCDITDADCDEHLPRPPFNSFKFHMVNSGTIDKSSNLDDITPGSSQVAVSWECPVYSTDSSSLQVSLTYYPYPGTATSVAELPEDVEKDNILFFVTTSNTPTKMPYITQYDAETGRCYQRVRAPARGSTGAWVVIQVHDAENDVVLAQTGGVLSRLSFIPGVRVYGGCDYVNPPSPVPECGIYPNARLTQTLSQASVDFQCWDLGGRPNSTRCDTQYFELGQKDDAENIINGLVYHLSWCAKPLVQTADGYEPTCTVENTYCSSPHFDPWLMPGAIEIDPTTGVVITQGPQVNGEDMTLGNEPANKCRCLPGYVATEDGDGKVTSCTALPVVTFPELDATAPDDSVASKAYVCGQSYDITWEYGIDDSREIEIKYSFVDPTDLTSFTEDDWVLKSTVAAKLQAHSISFNDSEMLDENEELVDEIWILVSLVNTSEFFIKKISTRCNVAYACTKDGMQITCPAFDVASAESADFWQIKTSGGIEVTDLTSFTCGTTYTATLTNFECQSGNNIIKTEYCSVTSTPTETFEVTCALKTGDKDSCASCNTPKADHCIGTLGDLLISEEPMTVVVSDAQCQSQCSCTTYCSPNEAADTPVWKPCSRWDSPSTSFYRLAPVSVYEPTCTTISIERDVKNVFNSEIANNAVTVKDAVNACPTGATADICTKANTNFKNYITCPDNNASCQATRTIITVPNFCVPPVADETTCESCGVAKDTITCGGTAPGSFVITGISSDDCELESSACACDSIRYTHFTYDADGEKVTEVVDGVEKPVLGDVYQVVPIPTTGDATLPRYFGQCDGYDEPQTQVSLEDYFDIQCLRNGQSIGCGAVVVDHEYTNCQQRCTFADNTSKTYISKVLTGPCDNEYLRPKEDYCNFWNATINRKQVCVSEVPNNDALVKLEECNPTPEPVYQPLSCRTLCTPRTEYPFYSIEGLVVTNAKDNQIVEAIDTRICKTDDFYDLRTSFCSEIPEDRLRSHYCAIPRDNQYEIISIGKCQSPTTTDVVTNEVDRTYIEDTLPSLDLPAPALNCSLGCYFYETNGTTGFKTFEEQRDAEVPRFVPECGTNSLREFHPNVCPSSEIEANKHRVVLCVYKPGDEFIPLEQENCESDNGAKRNTLLAEKWSDADCETRCIAKSAESFTVGGHIPIENDTSVICQADSFREGRDWCWPDDEGVNVPASTARDVYCTFSTETDHVVGVVGNCAKDAAAGLAGLVWEPGFDPIEEPLGNDVCPVPEWKCYNEEMEIVACSDITQFLQEKYCHRCQKDYPFPTVATGKVAGDRVCVAKSVPNGVESDEYILSDSFCNEEVAADTPLVAPLTIDCDCTPVCKKDLEAEWNDDCSLLSTWSLAQECGDIDTRIFAWKTLGLIYPEAGEEAGEEGAEGVEALPTYQILTDIDACDEEEYAMCAKPAVTQLRSEFVVAACAKSNVDEPTLECRIEPEATEGTHDTQSEDDWSTSDVVQCAAKCDLSTKYNCHADIKFESRCMVPFYESASSEEPTSIIIAKLKEYYTTRYNADELTIFTDDVFEAALATCATAAEAAVEDGTNKCDCEPIVLCTKHYNTTATTFLNTNFDLGANEENIGECDQNAESEETLFASFGYECLNRCQGYTDNEFGYVSKTRTQYCRTAAGNVEVLTGTQCGTYTAPATTTPTCQGKVDCQAEFHCERYSHESHVDPASIRTAVTTASPTCAEFVWELSEPIPQLTDNDVEHPQSECWANSSFDADAVPNTCTRNKPSWFQRTPRLIITVDDVDIELKTASQYTGDDERFLETAIEYFTQQLPYTVPAQFSPEPSCNYYFGCTIQIGEYNITAIPNPDTSTPAVSPFSVLDYQTAEIIVDSDIIDFTFGYYGPILLDADDNSIRQQVELQWSYSGNHIPTSPELIWTPITKFTPLSGPNSFEWPLDEKSFKYFLLDVNGEVVNNTKIFVRAVLDEASAQDTIVDLDRALKPTKADRCPLVCNGMNDSPSNQCVKRNGEWACECVAVPLANNNNFVTSTGSTPTGSCSRTKVCDDASSQCQNGGYREWRSILVAADECNARCTCPGGQRPEDNCATCSKTCDTKLGVPRTADEVAIDQNCGCKSCLPGLYGEYCEGCMVSASMLISNPSTAMYAWYDQSTPRNTPEKQARAEWEIDVIEKAAERFQFAVQDVSISYEESKIVTSTVRDNGVETTTTSLRLVFIFVGPCKFQQSAFNVLGDLSALDDWDLFVTEFAGSPLSDVTTTSTSQLESGGIVAPDAMVVTPAEPIDPADQALPPVPPSEPVDPNAPIDTEDPEPSGPTTPEPKAKKSNKNALILGLVLGLGLPLILIAAFLVYWFVIKDSGSSSSSGSSTKSTKQPKSKPAAEDNNAAHLELS